MGTKAGKNRRLKRQILCLCTECGVKTPVDGKLVCLDCAIRMAEYSKALFHKRKANGGVCCYCGKPSLLARCQNCKGKDQLRQEKRRELMKLEGRCVRCSADKNMIDTRCLKCVMKAVSLTNTGTKKNWKFFIDLLEQQDSKCFYTGEQLVVGINASIDHLLPVSRFPEKRTHSKNLVWCTNKINIAKGALTYSEFINLCNTVLLKSINGVEESIEKDSEILEGVLSNKRHVKCTNLSN